MEKNLALFDFDGTISTKDSISEFLKFIEPNYFKYIYIKYIYSFPYNISYKVGLISYSILKKKRLEFFFKNKNYSDLVILGTKFAAEVLPNLIKPSALNAIKNHLKNNDDIYIVSASLDIILKDWCNSLNIELITNYLDPNIKTIKGQDCNYNVKVLLLNERVDLSVYKFIFAYGDTEGDIPMLNLAHNKFYKYFN